MQRHIGTMLVYKNIAKLFLTILVILSLSSCGGGGGGDSSPRARDKGTISGIVFDAPVTQAVVTAYEYQNGKVGRKLGSATTSPYGEYSIEVDASSMPLYIEAKGGAYKDPLTDDIVETSEGKPIRIVSVINYGEGNDQDVMITPLTYMVTGLAEYKIQNGIEASSAIDDALNTINAMYGFNVNSVKPIDITRGGISGSATEGHRYGALLTAYSSYAYDFIDENGNAGNVYSSLNLSDIGYRDISADGYLNGQELDRTGSFSEPIYFGIEEVTSDTYTNQMAEHTLVVVSDPNLNVSKTPIDDYLAMTEHLNALGTNGSADGAIPEREETVIDDQPPVATRSDEGVLKGIASIDVALTDAVGVKSASVTLRHKFDEGDSWSESACSSTPNEGDICWVDVSEFVEGTRETSLTVYIDTEQLDPVEVEQSPEAYLLIQATDVMGNSSDLLSGSEIPFEWDNIAPIIEITSAETINSEMKTYVLKGLVKENPEYLKDKNVHVSLSNGEPESYPCTKIFGDEIWCEFETIGYLTENFGDKANFRVTTEDIHGNVGVLDFTLYNDNTPPTIYLTYPNKLFYVEDEVGDVYQIDYSDTTYNHESVESATQYLKVLYDYASKGLAATLGAIDPDLEFTDFIGQDLVDQSVPYVSATISDQSDGETYGSSAENLTLRVKYYSKKEGDEEYRYHYTAEQVASDAVEGENKGIPFEKLEFEDDNTVPRMTYIIPYVKEVLGLTYGDKTSEDIQKLVISVLDASGNESEPEEVYYRTSFDMPEVTVVTPFIDAQVRLEGLSSSGSFNYLNSCDTVQVDGQKDVASCTIPYDSSGYEFFRVYLGSKSNTHYYQWSLDQSTPVYIPPSVNVGAYFSEVDKNTLYITEFSSYHTGLFDSQWNNLDGDEKTAEKARLILDEVNSALDAQERSMLGFDPVTTEYATNRMLSAQLPDPLTDKFIYRFLLESLTNMAWDNSAENSSTFDYASAFYRDLSYDGLANGEDKSGPIKIGNYTLSSDTYRNELAQGYYDVAYGIHGVESKVALEQADHFATAYPEFADQNVFEDEGGSIDQQAPSVVVAPNDVQTHGSFTEVGNDTDYNIAGIIHSKVTIEDIATVNDQQTVLSAYWIGNSKKKTQTSIEFTLNDSESTEYIKVYDFIINSLLPEFDGVEKFEIEATVEDGIGNSEGPYIASTYYVDNEPPVGSLTTVAPEYPTEADDVTVTLQFDEPVTAVSATFDDIDIDFGESKDFKELWTGTTSEVISLNPDENSKKLVVSAYHDELNNVGAEFTEDIIVTPVITIDDVTDNNIVDDEEDNVTDITFSGTTTGFLKDSELSVNVVSDKRPNIDKFEFTEVKVNQEGVWSISNQDMSSWEESDFTIEVTGRNSEESEYVTEDKPSKYVDSIAPEVIQSQISMSGSAVTLLPVNSDEVLIDGEIATVTLTFSERVSKPESLLNGQLITFNQPADGDVAKTWVGTSPELVLPESESTSKLVVTNYIDTAGEPNSGAPYEKTVDVKPIILMQDISDLTTNEARDFVVSGTARGFENNAQLSVVVSSDNPINEDEELNLTAIVTNGTWTTAPEDISSWESGTLTITVDGSNGGGQAAEQASQEVELEDDIEPKVNGITVNSGDPIIDNQTAFVSLTFSERVENVVANVDGVDVTFTSRDAAKTVWEGTTSEVVALNANEMFKTVTVTQYQDAQGNSGEEDSIEAPVKPLIEITERGDSIDEDESSQVVISGTARGFQAGDTVRVVAQLADDPSNYNFDETRVVAEGGAWATSEQNIRDWPSGDINLTVIGQNNNGVAADIAKDTITYEDATPPTVDGEIVFNPEFPVDGEKVTIT
ncbi:tandem large repeat, partial [Vibrio coralliilyticus]|uniref:tandem large repeat n=1 Tax=Vibrio coralliilyticus TaxID=190893 RepID=UPI001180F00C